MPFVDECFTYDDVLRKNGHFVGGEALQGPQNGAQISEEGGTKLAHPKKKELAGVR